MGKRGDKMKKILSSILILFCCLGFFGTTNIYSQENNQEALTVSSETDKSDYNKDEQISLKITVKNNSNNKIEIYKITNDTSDDLKIADNGDYNLPLTLSAGQTYNFNYIIEQSKLDSSQSNSSGNSADQTQKDENQESTKNEGANTGVFEYKQILLYSLLIIGSGAVLIVIIRQKKARKLMVFILSISLSAGLALNIPSKVLAAEKDMASTTTSITVNGTNQTIKTNVYYEIDEEDTPIIDNTSYTRAEWINNLVNVYGLEKVSEKDYTSEITDISDNSYKDSIITAEAYQLFDLSTNEFRPNDIATREFAATTTTNLLGFLGNGTPDCQDANLIQDQNSVYFALKQGYMWLENGYFRPNDALTHTEGNTINNYITNTISSTDCSENINEIVYSDNTIILNGISYSFDGSKLIVEKNKDTEQLKVNDIVSINDELLIRILSISDIGNSIEIVFETPDMTESISSIQVSGTPMIDWDAFYAGSAATLKDDNAIKITKCDIDEDTNTFNLDIDVYGQPQSLDFTLNIDQKFDIDVLNNNITNLTFLPTLQSNINLLLDTEKSDDISEVLSTELTLFTIPFKIGPASIDVPVVIYIDLSGKVTLDVDAKYRNGFQILNNDIRFIRSASLNYDLVAEASLKTQLGLAPEITVFEVDNITDGIYVLGGNIRGGVATDVTVIPRLSSTINVCADLDVYAIADYSIDEDCFTYWLLTDVVNPDLEAYMSKEIFNKDNSPISGNLHYEDWVKKDHCTFDDEQQFNNVSLTLYDASSLNPISNHSINIVIDQNTNENSFVTDDNGTVTFKYSVSDLQDPNELNLTIRAEGYLTKIETVDLAEFPGTIALDVFLETPEEGSIYNPENGHYYKAFNEIKSWDEAKALCEQMGGHLVTITSENEQKFLETNGLTGRRWIGLSLDVSRAWSWVTGEPFDYENWADGEPNNSSNVIPNETCVALWPVKWNDLNNASREQNGYICEWE